MYSSQNNGGALNIFGVPCKTNLPEVYNDPLNMIILDCSHSMINNEQILKRAMVLGSTFLISCVSSCATEPDDIWGSQIYSEDSSNLL